MKRVITTTTTIDEGNDTELPKPPEKPQSVSEIVGGIVLTLLGILLAPVVLFLTGIGLMVVIQNPEIITSKQKTSGQTKTNDIPPPSEVPPQEPKKNTEKMPMKEGPGAPPEESTKFPPKAWYDPKTGTVSWEFKPGYLECEVPPPPQEPKKNTESPKKEASGALPALWYDPDTGVVSRIYKPGHLELDVPPPPPVPKGKP